MSEEKTSRDVFMITQVMEPDVLHFKVWDIIKPLVAQITDGTMNEYNEMEIESAIKDGMATLYMAYELPWTEDKDPDDIQMHVEIIKHLVNSKTPDTGLIGYVIARYRPSKGETFLWQVFIQPKYQQSPLAQKGFEWLTKEFANRGSQWLAAACYNNPTETLCKMNGFEKTYTVFRRSIKKDDG